MKQVSRLLLMLCVAVTISARSSALERKLAVVIGVDAYRSNSGLPRLQHATADAKALSSTLRDVGFTVYEMTHEVARQPGEETMAPQLAYIRDQIKGVLDFPNLGAKDSVLITLHGHGVQYDLIENGKKTPKFYFCPADATVSGLKTANDITDRNRLLPLDELYADLEACKAATKLLIVDACRNDPTSPSVFRESLASSTLPKLPAPTGGTAAFFSCKANQRAVEDAALKQGVFSHFLVKALKGEADLPLAGKPADGIVTFAELSAYVANNTYSHVFDKFKVSQSPELRGDYDLNLPIARFYDAPAIATPWTDKQLDQQLSSTFKTRLLYETSVMNQTKELEKEDHALEFVLSAYKYHRDISVFGLKSEYAELRGQILLALKSVELVLKNPPDEKENPKRYGRVDAVHTLIAEWLTWDTLSDKARERLVAMHPKLDEDNFEPARRDKFYRKTKATAVLAVRPTFPESAHASLVLRALRDRYWTLSMHSHQPSQRLPQLQLTTLLQYTSLPDNSAANIPRDRPVVVQFSGFTWCPPCRFTLEGWKTIQDELGDEFSLVFVSVDSDQLEGKKIVEESGVQAIWLELGELREEVMPVESFPSAFFCDAAGRVVEPSAYDRAGTGLLPRNKDQTQIVLTRLRELIANATP